MHLQTSPRIGIGLALIGGLIISLDIPVIRLAGSDPWFFMVFRGFGMASVLGAILLFAPSWTQTPKHPFGDRDYIEVGLLYGLSSICFTLSVFSTSAANLVFILAFNPLIAAVLAWIIIGEKPKLSTWLAIVFTLIGISIIVSGSFETGTSWGDFLALMTALVLGLSVVRARKSGKDMSLAGCLGGLLAGLFALPIALVNSGFPSAPEWVWFNAFVMAPAGAFALSLAPRYIPAPQVALFFLLETILAPVWIWIIFADIPSDRTLIGGAIVLVAIAGHTYVQFGRTNKPNIS